MHSRRVLAVPMAVAMMFGALVATPAAAHHGVNGKICIINETGGDSSPFNRAAATGAAKAEAKLHVETLTLDAETGSDIINNIDTFVTAGDCDLIIGLGFTVALALEPFIATNPAQQFAVMDFSFASGYSNTAEVLFRADQSAFLAGYVAAGISETGKVGTFGGRPIPPVTFFMDGYAFGVEYYNAQHGTSVEVLGWDPDLQTGLFTFNFDNPADGQAMAGDLYDLGADTVFPVAGVTGYGALTEAELRKAAGGEVRVIGVDSDWSRDFGDPSRVILTSVVKDYGPAVFHQAAAIADGSWQGDIVWEDLASGGTYMAPFGKTNRQVPGYLKNDLKAIKVGITDGSIPTIP